MNQKTSDILKTQRVTRRPSNFFVVGNTALAGIEQIKQNPVRKKRIQPYSAPRGNKGFVQTEDENIKFRLPFKLTPNIILIFFCIAGVAFFSYYALLWNDDMSKIKLSEDKIAHLALLDYAEGSIHRMDMLADSMPLNTSETFTWLNYMIKKGDSVSKIAADHGLSMDAVIASNNMTNARSLREGEVIRIPNMDGIPYTVVKGDTYKKIADAMNVPVEAILDANDIQDDNIIVGTQLFIPGAKMKADELRLAIGELFIYPVRGRLTSSYGWRRDPFNPSGTRRFHHAIDLSSHLGTPVKAAMAGKITSVDFDNVYGNYIIITHSSGYQSMYAHLSATSVSKGARVEQGAEIGKVGSTGQSTGAHLHFAIYKNGRSINPLEYLKL
ncbi:hypothetical protein FACS1894190_05630 [Spirochaetia bacterium]|nr:hypothetical protein FACS1894190_05630 [Spirochaetia bacterium]